MQLTVLVDNMTVRQGMLAEWGYSVLIESGERKVLLDTGGIKHVLLDNLAFLKIDPAMITDLVLSHGHFDHTSGVIDILRTSPNVKVWAGKNVARARWGDADGSRLSGGGAALSGLPFTAVDPHCEIVSGITAFTVPQAFRDPRWVETHHMFEKDASGNLVPDTFADDVSLFVETENGASLVLGCAHAGLPNIMAYAAKTFGVTAFNTVLGGTHLCSAKPECLGDWMQELAKYPVKHWRPCHCTGFRAAAELARHFEDVDWAAAGSVHRL